MTMNEYKKMSLNQLVNKYIWDNPSRGEKFKGIFNFQEISVHIGNHISSRENLSATKFIDELFKLYKKKIDKYINIIQKETQKEKDEINKVIKKRLANAFEGLFGEHILYNMIPNCGKYRVIELTEQDDYGKAVDIKVEEVFTGKILYIQVKTINYLNNPTPWHTTQLEKEKRKHEENDIKVNYFYYNHDYKNRYFSSDNNIISFIGYGSGQTNDLEIELDRLMKLYGVKVKDKVTAETIIF